MRLKVGRISGSLLWAVSLSVAAADDSLTLPELSLNVQGSVIELSWQSAGDPSGESPRFTPDIQIQLSHDLVQWESAMPTVKGGFGIHPQTLQMNLPMEERVFFRMIGFSNQDRLIQQNLALHERRRQVANLIDGPPALDDPRSLASVSLIQPSVSGIAVTITVDDGLDFSSRRFNLFSVAPEPQ